MALRDGVSAALGEELVGVCGVVVGMLGRESVP